MQCPVAVLLLVFKRPEATRITLERLREVRPPRLYIHSDAPRPDRLGETAAVAAVRDLVTSAVDWPCEIFMLVRSENAGLRRGVSGAVSWFFEHEPYGIILEDDCVPDPSFFQFCGELLVRYEADERIMHIGGSNLAEACTANLPESYVFSQFSFVWGWASWRRAWVHFRLELEGLDEYAHSEAFRRFLPDPLARNYMLDKFRVTRLGLNQSWAYAWFYSIIRRQGLCIVPARNAVQNIGIGGAGATHTTARDAAAGRRAQAIRFPLVHPDSQMPDMRLEQTFFYTSQKKRYRLWLWTILRAFR